MFIIRWSGNDGTTTVHKRTPRRGEGGLVDLELGFGQTASRYSATGVRDLLDATLGIEKLIDFSTQGSIFPANNFFGNHFESERSVTNPSIEIVRVDGVRAGDDDPGLGSENFSQTGVKDIEVDEPLRQMTWNLRVLCWPRGPTLQSGTLSRCRTRRESVQRHSRCRRTRRSSTGRQSFAWSEGRKNVENDERVGEHSYSSLEQGCCRGPHVWFTDQVGAGEHIVFDELDWVAHGAGSGQGAPISR